MARGRKLVQVVGGIVAGIVVLVGIQNLRNSESYECEKVAIQAKPGDDYWGYIEDHCEGNLEVVRADVVEFYGPTLMPGRVIYLPTSDECELKLVSMSNGNEYVYETCPE